MLSPMLLLPARFWVGKAQDGEPTTGAVPRGCCGGLVCPGTVLGS